MFIQTEPTPNPATLKFLPGMPVMGQGTAFYTSVDAAQDSPLARALFDIDHVTAVFFGEGATEEGVFLESVNFAALKKLPVVFVCENNLYSVYSPMHVRQPAERNRVALARDHGIYAERAEGNVQAVYQLSEKAVRRARSGEGPAYLEFDTYRWREHCGPNYDNHIGYRTEAEFQNWRKRCPIQTYQQVLLAEGIVSELDVKNAAASFRKEIDLAFAHAQSGAFPDDDELTNGVYA